MIFLPNPEMVTDWKTWANDFLAIVGPILQPLGMDRPVLLPQFPKADLPPAVQAGTLIFVPDDVGGAVVAFDDGAGEWRRVTDRAVIS